MKQWADEFSIPAPAPRGCSTWVSHPSPPTRRSLPPGVAAHSAQAPRCRAHAAQAAQRRLSRRAAGPVHGRHEGPPHVRTVLSWRENCQWPSSVAPHTREAHTWGARRAALAAARRRFFSGGLTSLLKTCFELAPRIGHGQYRVLPPRAQDYTCGGGRRDLRRIAEPGLQRGSRHPGVEKERDGGGEPGKETYLFWHILRAGGGVHDGRAVCAVGVSSCAARMKRWQLQPAACVRPHACAAMLTKKREIAVRVAQDSKPATGRSQEQQITF
jgi:hypothetical protein